MKHSRAASKLSSAPLAVAGRPTSQARPKAYSYLRFSTPEQLKGDSKRRQTQAAEEYALRHGLELDTQLRFNDLGVSAFRGKNAEEGQLGVFRDLAESGQIPKGSYLLVESLDRVSRTTPRKAVRILERICEAGVNVVTLSDSKVYNEHNLDSDGGMSLIMSVLIFVRANEESVMKSSRVRAAWDAKREKAISEGTPLTSVGPAWLRVGADGRHEVIPERAKIVRRILKEYAKGRSVVSIVRALNSEGVETFGNMGSRKATQWHQSYIQKIVRNPAVVGTYQPKVTEFDKEANKMVRRPATEPIRDYYPAIVPESLWQTVTAMVADTKQSLRGKAAASGDIKNLLGGLGVCAKCGSTMTRVSKGGKPGQAVYSYLVCVKGRYGKGCDYKAISYDSVEASLLRDAPALFAAAPASPAKGEQLLETKLRHIEESIETLEERRGELRDLIVETGSRALVADMQAAEKEIEALAQQRSEIAMKLEASSGPFVAARLSELREALKDPKSGESRKRVNALLRALLVRAEVDTEEACVRLVWKKGGVTEFAYGFPKET